MSVCNQDLLSDEALCHTEDNVSGGGSCGVLTGTGRSVGRPQFDGGPLQVLH